jgi:hypothetical protein
MTTIWMPGVLLGAAVITGCTDKSSMTEFFGPEDNTRRMHQAAAVQADCGAQEDATLYAFHFTGGRLNSLGAAKLARLVPDDSGAAVNVHLDLSDDELAAQRKEAVATYMRACGVEDAQLKLAMGPNPNLTAASATGLARLSRTESTGAAESEDATTPSYAPQGMGQSQ